MKKGSTKGGTPSGASGGTLGRESEEGICGRTDAGGHLLVGYDLVVKSFFIKMGHPPVTIEACRPLI